jgi:hypothetical protein
MVFLAQLISILYSRILLHSGVPYPKFTKRILGLEPHGSALISVPGAAFYLGYGSGC